MLILLSPAKKLFPDATIPNFIKPTEPIFFEQAWQLISQIKQQAGSSDEKNLIKLLTKLMQLSPKLALENAKRFLQFQANPQIGTPALYSFAGDTYRGFQATSLTPALAELANNHIRILSGLYGYLKAFDRIQPYRLEMGVKLTGTGFTDLYDYWQELVTAEINQTEQNYIINCASAEYSNLLKPEKLQASMITIDFKILKKGKPSGLGMAVKFYRGQFARQLLEHIHQVNSTDGKFISKNLTFHDLSTITIAGFRFVPELSNKTLICYVKS